MTEQPTNRHLGSDALQWLDTLINAHENDVHEILENCLHYLTSEGEATLTQGELVERIKAAIARIEGQAIDSEVEARFPRPNSQP